MNKKSNIKNATSNYVAGTSNKNGVSLIVLVITIIVMIILAGTIILSLNDSGIISKSKDAVKETNLKEVQTLASLKWAEAYMNGIRKQEQLEEQVLQSLNEEKIDLTQYEIFVSKQGVEVYLKGQAVWTTTTVDGVPIPRGFVASSVAGENTKNGGLVIYEGTEAVTDSNVENAKRTRNQYVWVPVEDFSKFVRKDFGDSYAMSNTLGTAAWEVALDTTTNMPLPTQNSTYMTSTTLAEVQAMYESVKKYKGFYVARYEAGIDTQRTSDNGVLETNVYSMMGKMPYAYIPWTKNDSISEDTNGAVEVARSIYPQANSRYGVVSTLTYGVQWDRTLAWWLEVGAKDGKGNAVTSVTSSTSYGNYSDHVISAGDLNEGAKYAAFKSGSLGSYQTATTSSTKASGTNWALSTGALKAASVNNIFDMAGNMWEWTMEGATTTKHVFRGGFFSVNGSSRPVFDRNTATPTTVGFRGGFRLSLYIK